ncbi:hypothetical protein E4N62_16710 [Streptomyces sp. MNU76]|uniref:hypothetical protein n=1 Tax=Streptomyces sp. MNU76 TaxID=2560026 RepID=UPI001E64B5A7|nr:hypothetical protein [Streptomyces sp. MNU76]MCC9706771.1 hypothetical protein [Streptomyces sp. MNU76]
MRKDWCEKTSTMLARSYGLIRFEKRASAFFAVHSLWTPDTGRRTPDTGHRTPDAGRRRTRPHLHLHPHLL